MINNNLFHNNKKTFRSVVVITLILIATFVAGAKWQGKNNQIKALSVQLAEAKENVVYVEPDTVDAYIKYVFGEDYPKAMLLLKGKGDGTCAENRYLNPNAVNDNTEWGGVGRDIGVFQINTKWQGVQEKFLYDYKVNIRIAHQLFEENGKSFKLWTCGRQYGI